MVQLFSETRFCGASIMLNSILKNKSHLQNLADLLKSKKYGGIAKSVRPVGGHLRPTHDFIQKMGSTDFRCKISSVGGLIQLIARACAISETQGFKSAHVYPLMRALRKEVVMRERFHD